MGRAVRGLVQGSLGGTESSAVAAETVVFLGDFEAASFQFAAFLVGDDVKQAQKLIGIEVVAQGKPAALDLENLLVEDIVRQRGAILDGEVFGDGEGPGGSALFLVFKAEDPSGRRLKSRPN